MKQNPFWDRVFATASWILVFALVYAAVAIWFAPITAGGPVANVLTENGTRVVYCVLYGGLAGLLGYSKWRKKKKMRKHVLVAIYFVGTFTFILGWMLTGIAFPLLDNLIMGFVAGFCWLYWKFKTEYIHPDTFANEIDGLRDDLPPPS